MKLVLGHIRSVFLEDWEAGQYLRLSTERRTDSQEASGFAQFPDPPVAFAPSAQSARRRRLRYRAPLGLPPPVEFARFGQFRQHFRLGTSRYE